jgi:hypothetical protein
MLSSEANVIIWDEMLSSGANVIIWDEMLSSGMQCYHLELFSCRFLAANLVRARARGV